MRMRRAAVAFAAMLLTISGTSSVLAVSPGSPGVLVVAAPAAGGGLTVSLASGSRVHVQPVRGSAAARAAVSTSTSSGVRVHAGAGAAVITGNGINYNGGPIVPAEKVAAVYWAASTVFAGGPASGSTGSGAQDGSLVGYFLGNLGGSAHYGINTTYGDSVGAGHTVANALSYTGYWADAGSAPVSGANVSDTAVQNEIIKGFTGGQLAYDPSTVYAVFTGAGVNLGGGAFTQYCAYHGDFSWNGNTVLYAVMPYDYTNPAACSGLSGSPNADPAADTEVSTLVHELEEANTDPQLNAWYDSAGNENADKCAWNFGTTFTSGGGKANVTIGSKSFLVQQNWLNANGGKCVQSWSTAPATVPGSPTGVTASSSAGSVTVRWSPPASNGGAAITGYGVYRATTSGAETLLTTLGNVTSFTDGAVSQGTTYYYEVSAINGVGSGALSAEAFAAPGQAAGRPGAPALTAATSSSRRGVQLSWSVPSNGGTPITGYRVYRSTTVGAEVLITTRSAGSTSYRDSSTSSGVTYFYQVTAVNAVGEGARSGEASARAR